MPRNLHAKLLASARKRGFGKRRTDAYVFGTMRKVKRR